MEDLIAFLVDDHLYSWACQFILHPWSSKKKKNTYIKKKKEGSKVMHNPFWDRVGLLPEEYHGLQRNKIHIGVVNN